MEQLIDHLVPEAMAELKTNIASWKLAQQEAENTERPRRAALMDTYSHIGLDGELTAVWARRIEAQKGRQFSVQKDGEHDEELTELLNTEWFEHFMEYALESISHGHSLIQLHLPVDGRLNEVTLIDRRHVVPELGIALKEIGDDEGIKYRQEETYEKLLIEAGKKTSLGFLNKIVPYALFSKWAMVAMNEFVKNYGKPWLLGKTNVKDKKAVSKMADMLNQAGANTWAVIDRDEVIDFIEANTDKGEVFKAIIDYCNAYINKIILGAITGSDSKGGSYAKEKVGENINNIFRDADGRFLQRLINNKLIPKLAAIGYPFDNCRFKFISAPDIEKLWQVVRGLLPFYNIPEDWISETFQIPVERKEEPGLEDDKKGKDDEGDDNEELNYDGFFA